MQKAVNAWDSSDRRQKRVLLETVHSNCLWDGERVIPEYRQPFDLIALTNAGEKEKTASEEAEKVISEKWLPGRPDLRTNLGPWLEDDAVLYPLSEKRRIRFSFYPPAEKTRRFGIHRRWLRNPVLVAREIAAEMDATPGATQDSVAAARGVTRTRVCQYLRLLLLPKDILDYIADPDNEEHVARVTESSLRCLLREPSPVEQRRAFYAMIEAGEMIPDTSTVALAGRGK